MRAGHGIRGVEADEGLSESARDTGAAMMRYLLRAIVAILAFEAFALSSSHAQAIQPPERVSPMYPGEQIVEAAGFPALVKF